MAADGDKRTRYRLQSLATAVLLITLTVLLAWLSIRYPVQADWTRNGRYTLSAASAAVLKQAGGKLSVTAYARDQRDLHQAIRRFVAMYQKVKPDIELKFVNIDAAPERVRREGIRVNGELVVSYRGRSEHVRSATEANFTHAVQRLIRGSQRWLAFLQGHGERDPLGKANYDLGEWAQQLRERGFRLQSINLGKINAIPENTSVLVIASPQVRLLTGEIAAVVQYVQDGGNLLWLRDPGDRSGLAPLAEALHLKFGHGTVIDTAGRLLGIDNPTVTVITKSLYGDHPALKGFHYTTLFPGAVSLRYTGKDEWQATSLLNTGDHTWLESGPLAGQVRLDPGKDTPGPLSIGLALERHRNGNTQRVAVIGDGDFLSNTYVENAGNMALGLRLVNWLSGDDDLIDIPDRTVEDTRLNMPSTLTGSIGLFFLIVLPALLLLTGATVWWRRRKR
jgi:ABC-type uncharacterized transport system involved in gliding motility auxiliary subunit